MTHHRFLDRLPVAALLAALATGLLAAALPALAQGVPPDSLLRDFQRNGDYVLEVDGKPVRAEIYLAERVPALLIISSALPSPVLLTPRAQVAETVNLMKVNKKPDGSVDLLADARLARQSALDVVDEDIRFTSEGRKCVLKPKPPLLGVHPANDLTTYSPEYAQGAADYSPNGQMIAALKKETRPINVRVYFGSWCPHCRQLVPHIIKVEQELKGSKIHFEYYGLPRNFGKDAEAMKMGVRSVPTGVVYVNGKETGRLDDPTAWESVEAALNSVLHPAPAAKGR